MSDAAGPATKSRAKWYRYGGHAVVVTDDAIRVLRRGGEPVAASPFLAPLPRKYRKEIDAAKAQA